MEWYNILKHLGTCMLLPLRFNDLWSIILTITAPQEMIIPGLLKCVSFLFVFYRISLFSVIIFLFLYIFFLGNFIELFIHNSWFWFFFVLNFSFSLLSGARECIHSSPEGIYCHSVFPVKPFPLLSPVFHFVSIFASHAVVLSLLSSRFAPFFFAINPQSSSVIQSMLWHAFKFLLLKLEIICQICTIFY